MSQQKKKRDDNKSSETSLGTSVATGAAVVGFAALAYGAWKLYDFLSASGEAAASPSANTEAKPAKALPESSDEEGSSSSMRRRINNFPEGNHSLKGNSSNSSSKAEISLTTQLLAYYCNYVEVEPNEMRETMNILKTIKMQFSRHLRKNKQFQELHICELEETGSSTDGLMVIFPENVDVIIPFQLNPEECCINLQEPTNQYSSVLLKLSSDAWSEVSNEEKYLVPSKFIEALKKDFEDAVLACKIECLKSMIYETSLAVDVCHGRKKFTIHFCPALKIGAKVFVTDVPYAVKLSNPFLWRESFHLLEFQRLNNLSLGVSGHKVILKIIKAVRLNFPLQFGLLSSYHYKTILLHLMDFQTDVSDWETSAISERFIDFLIELGRCLKERNLPHYFLVQCNLLDGISPEISEKLSHFVNQIVGHRDISRLLKSDYLQY